MTKDVYEVVADVNELKWFFEHVIQKPQVNESYTAVFVCRHKKLTDQEKVDLCLTRKQAEFLDVATFRLCHIHDAESLQDNVWTFDKFLKQLRKFEVNKEAYTTGSGLPLPDKTLATIFYVNPCDNMKVCDKFVEEYNAVYTAIAKAHLGGKDLADNYQSYQWFDNAEDTLKHLRANQKGSRYWMDFDCDVPAWFKPLQLDDWRADDPNAPTADEVANHNKYYLLMLEKLNTRFGKGNYVIVDTSGGYHVLVRTNSIKSNPHDFCKEVKAIYEHGIADGHPEYLDEKGNCKFEAIVNDSQIPGLPLPGTWQYGHAITVLNKDDFE